MSVYAIADLHLAFGVPEKSMEFFGPVWKEYTQRIESSWKDQIKADDLVLIAGDISWAKDIEDAAKDLEWIHSLPGTKVLLRGNHDYWWNSLSKVQKILPPSMHLIQNNVFNWGDLSIGGSRLWDTQEYSFGSYIHYIDNPRAKKMIEPEDPAEQEKIFERELQRLEISLSGLKKSARHKLAMTHYPPIGAELNASRAADILEKHGVDICVFGHLHNVKKDALPFGKRNGVNYILTAADYIDFKPVKIL